MKKNPKTTYCFTKMSVTILENIFPDDPETQVAIRIKLAPAILKVAHFRRNAPPSKEDLAEHVEFFTGLAAWVKEDPATRLTELSKLDAQDAQEIQDLFNGGQQGLDYFIDEIAACRD